MPFAAVSWQAVSAALSSPQAWPVIAALALLAVYGWRSVRA